MKKNLIILLLLLAIVYASAEYVTSTVDGGIISKLSKVGQTIKKGEMLVIFYQTGINAEIDALQADIESVKELLKTKKLDVERANKLVHRGVTQAELEDCIYDENEARCLLKKREAELRKLENDKTLRFIPAPCDCKIVEVYLIENVGTYVGQRILRIEKLN